MEKSAFIEVLKHKVNLRDKKGFIESFSRINNFIRKIPQRPEVRASFENIDSQLVDFENNIDNIIESLNSLRFIVFGCFQEASLESIVSKVLQEERLSLLPDHLKSIKEKLRECRDLDSAIKLLRILIEPYKSSQKITKKDVIRLELEYEYNDHKYSLVSQPLKINSIIISNFSNTRIGNNGIHNHLDEDAFLEMRYQAPNLLISERNTMEPKCFIKIVGRRKMKMNQIYRLGKSYLTVLSLNSDEAYIEVECDSKQKLIVRDRLIIGRTPKTDGFIRDQSLSKIHLEIFKKHEKWYIEDKSSRNGTWLFLHTAVSIRDNQKSPIIKIHHESSLLIGNYCYKVCIVPVE